MAEPLGDAKQTFVSDLVHLRIHTISWSEKLTMATCTQNTLCCIIN